MPNVNAVDLTSAQSKETTSIKQTIPDTLPVQVGPSIRKEDAFNTDIEDNGHSVKIHDNTFDTNEFASSDADNFFVSARHTGNLYKHNEIDYYNKRYRYGLLNPSDTLSTCREYLFFTKPDLNIYPKDDVNGTGDVSKSLAPTLQQKPFWTEIASKQTDVLKCLEYSIPTAYNGGYIKDPFNHLLENMVQSNLEVPELSADLIETAENMYGVNFGYRGSSEASDDGFDFSLEFKDTRYLPVYNFFRCYEDYETLKHHGLLKPYKPYIMNKILYDQYSIYKFMVSEDGETIVYYAKYYGVKSKSLPRNVFSNTSFDNGLSYSIDFNAAFFEDNKPTIISAFNKLSKPLYENSKYQIGIHNNVLDRADNRPVRAAYVIKQKDTYAPGGWVYKLKWRGDDEY